MQIFESIELRLMRILNKTIPGIVWHFVLGLAQEFGSCYGRCDKDVVPVTYLNGCKGNICLTTYTNRCPAAIGGVAIARVVSLAAH